MANRAIRSPNVYLDPAYLQRAADELASKARIVQAGLDEFTACEQVLYSIFSDEYDFQQMLNGKFDLEQYNG